MPRTKGKKKVIYYEVRDRRCTRVFKLRKACRPRKILKTVIFTSIAAFIFEHEPTLYNEY